MDLNCYHMALLIAQWQAIAFTSTVNAIALSICTRYQSRCFIQLLAWTARGQPFVVKNTCRPSTAHLITC